MIALVLGALLALPPFTPAVASKLDAAAQAGVGTGAHAAPSVSLAVVEDGKIVYARAFGTADAARSLPATPETRYAIGSLTKTFTAVAVMQLVERRRLSLDDTLAKYAPWYAKASHVTVRELLNHTSGIPNYLDAAFAAGFVHEPATPRKLVDSVTGDALLFTPGTKWAYSNTGYVLLGTIVERVSGMPLHEYVRTHVFAPAGMTQTTFGNPATAVPTAVGYAPTAAGAPAQSFDWSWLYADGDIVSTPSDIARFDIALMDGKLLAPQTFATMQHAPVATGEGSVAYGLGLSEVPFEGMRFVGHHGGLPGFESDNEMLPRERFAFVVFGNAFGFLTPTVSDGVLATFFPKAFARALAARASATAAPSASPAAEDSALTARFAAFFEALQRGAVDRGQLDASMSAALTPAALSAASAQFASFGTLQKLVFRGSDAPPGYTRYHYDAVFPSQHVPMTFVLDGAGKIAGFFLQ